jgi:hypothetical protein
MCTFMKAIGLCLGQRGTGLLHVDPIAILRRADREQRGHISSQTAFEKWKRFHDGAGVQLEIATVASRSLASPLLSNGGAVILR